MLYFSFLDYKEFAARKKNAAFIESINNTLTKFKTYKRKQRRITAGERRQLISEATARLFDSPQQAVSCIRKELESKIDGYSHLNIDAKQVTVAYLIVKDNAVCTLKRVTLDNTKWEFIPVRTMSQLVKSLEQKRKLVALADKQHEAGKLPEMYKNGRSYVASLIKEA